MVSSAKPRVFLSSGQETLPLARGIAARLQEEVDVLAWERVSTAGGGNWLRSVEDAVRRADLAIFLITDPDVDHLAGGRTLRHNVLWELGLSLGSLGDSRTYVMVVDGIDELPLPQGLRWIELLSQAVVPDDLAEQASTLIMSVLRAGAAATGEKSDRPASREQRGRTPALDLIESRPSSAKSAAEIDAYLKGERESWEV